MNWKGFGKKGWAKEGEGVAEFTHIHTKCTVSYKTEIKQISIVSSTVRHT
jgi:hypothetical protein